jgi:glycosyltransferase involved in cell wall biosynthesis
MSPHRKLRVLLAAPLPPPDYGGIATWTRIVHRVLGGRPDIELSLVDTMVRYRDATNGALWRRVTGGSAQAARDTFRIYWALRTRPVSLLHLCTSGGLATPKDILILQIAKLYGVPSIIHYRMGRIPTLAAENNMEWGLTKRAIQLATSVAVLDRMSEKCVADAVPGSRPVTLPNMVDTELIDSIGRRTSRAAAADETLQIVYLGHVIPTKGIRELVEACTRFPEIPLVLNIVGPYEQAFRRQLEEGAQKRAGPWIRFHGSVEHDEAVQHILNADLFVLPSYTEGAPNVILEALAASRAILGTSVGAVPEILDIGGPQECGVCVAPRDTDALAGALGCLLRDPDRRQELARKARQRAERIYDAPISSQCLLELWRAVGR